MRLQNWSGMVFVSFSDIYLSRPPVNTLEAASRRLAAVMKHWLRVLSEFLTPSWAGYLQFWAYRLSGGFYTASYIYGFEATHSQTCLLRTWNHSYHTRPFYHGHLLYSANPGRVHSLNEAGYFDFLHRILMPVSSQKFWPYNSVDLAVQLTVRL